jgi:hypothetical protein
MKPKTILAGFVILLVVATAMGSFPVSTDAGVYLAAARFTANGHLPYLHFPHAYTPLVLTLHSLLYFVFKQPPYWLFAALQCLVIAATCIITYATLVKKLSVKPITAGLLVVVQLAAMLAMQAQSILLEPWVLCFIWLSAYHLLPLPAGKGSTFWGGVFIGLAFLCKQYGAVAFPPFALLLFGSKRTRLLWALSLGAMAPIVLCLIILWGLGASPFSVLMQWYAKNHQQLNTGKLFSLFTWFWGGKFLLIILLPTFMLALQMLVKGKKLPQAALFGIGGGLLMLTPTLFRHFDHYFMMPLPFFIITLAALSNYYSEVVQTKILAAAGIFCLLAFGLRQWQNRHLLSRQLTNAQIVATLIPRESRVYVPYTHSYLIVLNGYLYPFAEKSGFAFMKLSPEYFKANANKNAAYISSKKFSGAIPLALPNADTIYLLKK